MAGFFVPVVAPVPIANFLHSALGAFPMLAAAAPAAVKSRAALHSETLALRHQLGLLQRSVKQPEVTAADHSLGAGHSVPRALLNPACSLHFDYGGLFLHRDG